MAKNDPDKKLTVREFFKRFPDEDACLEHVMVVRFGLRHTCRKCGVDSTFHKLELRKAYCCANCGDHLYPCAETIFKDSRTPLQIWFYAVYLFVTTRHGVSGKELQRQLGVTYKTAWRMGDQIRKLMAKADYKGPLSGHVECDELYFGGFRSEKTVIMGMVERGGAIRCQVVPDAKLDTLRGVVRANVERGSVVSTDEWYGYNLLEKDGYKHGAVKHSPPRRVWAWRNDRYGVVHHTNSVEGFWALFERSIKSTHIHIDRRFLDRYLGEFAMRSNFRHLGNEMFDALVAAL
jgi:transposase-like protein